MCHKRTFHCRVRLCPKRPRGECVDRPFPAYKGEEPYIFVCYAHEDSDVVYPELQRLHDGGVNIWYDEGIAPGHEWTQVNRPGFPGDSLV